MVFASLTLSEYNQVNTLNSQLSHGGNTFTETLTSTIMVNTTDTCPPVMACAAFGYSPNYQVKIASVEANDTPATTPLVFWVTVQNVATFPIQFTNFDLNFSVQDSPVLRQTLSPGFAGGSDITVTRTLESGESYTLDASFPNTKAFYYQIVQPGTVEANLNFTWTACLNTSCTTFAPTSNTTSISAQLVFA